MHNRLAVTNLTNLQSVEVSQCIFESHSQLSFTNRPSLKKLKFEWSKIESSASIAFSTLLALEELEFYQCTIDPNAWQWITDQIASSSVKELTLSSDFFDRDWSPFFTHLQKFHRILNIQIWILDAINRERVTTNLCNIARGRTALKSITVHDPFNYMSESSKGRIKRAGRERDPHSTIHPHETDHEPPRSATVENGRGRRKCTFLWTGDEPWDHRISNLISAEIVFAL